MKNLLKNTLILTLFTLFGIMSCSEENEPKPKDDIPIDTVATDTTDNNPDEEPNEYDSTYLDYIVGKWELYGVDKDSDGVYEVVRYGDLDDDGEYDETGDNNFFCYDNFGVTHVAFDFEFLGLNTSDNIYYTRRYSFCNSNPDIDYITEFDKAANTISLIYKDESTGQESLFVKFKVHEGDFSDRKITLEALDGMGITGYTFPDYTFLSVE